MFDKHFSKSREKLPHTNKTAHCGVVAVQNHPQKNAYKRVQSNVNKLTGFNHEQIN